MILYYVHGFIKIGSVRAVGFEQLHGASVPKTIIIITIIIAMIIIIIIGIYKSYVIIS